ncbi:MAG: pilus assembly protein TadD [Alphaproteobacteria bacterium]|nr:pilus assembly protein TadD [Alphaproteobacteria bacterium]
MSRVYLVTRAVCGLATLAIGACASTPETAELTPDQAAYMAAMEEASRPASAEQIAAAERSDPLTRANFWSDEYRKNPADPTIVLAFMTALRGIGSHDRAIEVATTALPIHPNDHAILLELARSQLALNQPQEAAIAFARSADYAPETLAAPLAGLGVALDQMEQHTKAQDAYRMALQREPNRVSTLSNYGLSLALSGDLINAEAQLRKAAAQPDANMRVRQNLALVLGLQGRFDEMVAVDPDAPRRTVEANRQALRTMMIPERTVDTYTAYDAPTPLPEVSTPDEAPTSALRPKLRGSQDD